MSETTWQNTARKLPAALLGFVLGVVTGSLALGNVAREQIRQAQTDEAICRRELDEFRGASTVLLEPAPIEILNGAVGIEPGTITGLQLPLAPRWIVPAKIQPSSTEPGRAYLWIGKSGAPQGPFVAGVSERRGPSWVFVPGVGGGR